MSDKNIVRVRDVMNTHFDMVDGLATIKDALCDAKHLSSRCFIVNKRHDDDEFGIVLLADIAKQVIAAFEPFDIVDKFFCAVVTELIGHPVAAFLGIVFLGARAGNG